MPVIEISSLEHPGVEIFCTLTEAQLRRQTESGKGLFIAESPNVISRALDAGYEPIALLCERKHITGDAAKVIERCGDVPVYTGARELLATWCVMCYVSACIPECGRGLPECPTHCCY